MIAVFLAGVLLAQASPAASPACRAGDISVTNLNGKTVKGSSRIGTDDRLLLTADFSNVGGTAQAPHTAQHAEVVHDGAVIASQPLPALAAGVTYPMTFRVFRAKADAKNQFAVTVRYVLDDPQKARNNCSAGNDSIQKTF